MYPGAVRMLMTRDHQREHTNNQTRTNTMIKSLRNKPLRIVAIAVLPLALLGTACGSDSDDDSPADTGAEAPDGTEASDDSDSEGSEGNPEVEAFCSQVDEFVTAMDEILADPTSGDAAAIAAQGQELSASAAELAGNVDSSDSDRLQECTEELSSIGS